MSKTQKQTLIDINNITIHLNAAAQEKIKKIAISLLDLQLIEIMPNLDFSELQELDPTEKLMLLKEYSMSEEERKKEEDEAVSFEQALKEAGLTIDDLQD